MGLDWVVLEKVVDGKEINPTEVIGSKRACRDDSEVVNELRGIWEGGDYGKTFDEWLDELLVQEYPLAASLFSSNAVHYGIY